MRAVCRNAGRGMQLWPAKIEQDIARVRAIEPDRDVSGRLPPLIALSDVEPQVVLDVLNPTRAMHRERLRYPGSIEAVSAAPEMQGG
jgi:hypothetical protein